MPRHFSQASTVAALSVDAVQYLIGKYVAIAGERMPSLKQKRVSPHSLRHSAAMELLQAGVECSVIALWLGHYLSTPPRSICTPISP